MNKKDEALKLALDALECVVYAEHDVQPAIVAIRQALTEQCVCGEPNTPGTHRTDGPCLAEQPAQQQEPVAVVSGYYGGRCVITPTNPAMLFNPGTALYTSPQPAQQEPVAFYVYKPTLPRGNLGLVADGDLPWVYDQDPASGFSARMLVMPVTSPPQRKPLTDEEIKKIWGSYFSRGIEFARAIEAAHGIKE